ncbi:Calcium-binding EF-hand [Corchorus olitorius]|uniref:Calcium-binding EF-hand n=1 Tax=Corchorus olitorius TaxID=93759 RepID=A0A1R3JC61_9ROSI|nr:Calcium-binding EF-hand [Corchorus olitorius]
MRNVARIAYFLLAIFMAMAMAAKGRFLPQLVSDGIDANHSSNSFLKEMVEDSSSSSSSFSSENCEQMYGFLPCSNSVYGHLFLILVYEYLLFHGESYLAHGGEQIFKILGRGFFGASAFQVICALPESLILLASGLLSTKEDAQEYAYTGVGLLAGSSILLLTIVWGTCLIVARQNLHNGAEYSLLNANANSTTSFSFKKLLHFSKRNGITTDQETSYTARIMVFSVIPFFIIQVLDFFTSSSAKQPVILITLSISVVFLLLYFFYQCFQPWIQQRKLEFVKHEYLVLKVLQHVQKRALTRILTYNGAPNVNAIRRIFEEIDQDGDEFISSSELRELLLEVKFTRSQINKEKAVEDVMMNDFDINGDQKITKDEFVNGFMKWLDVGKKAAVDKKYYSQKSLRDIYRLFQPSFENKRKEHEIKKNLISELLSYFQSSSIDSLLTQDGKPDITAIKRLFEKIDSDGDNWISQQELREVIMDVKFGKVPWNADEVVAKVIEELDTRGDKRIDEEEFINGISRWLKTSKNEVPPSPTPSIETEDDIFQKTWEETDKLVDEGSINGGVVASKWAWIKAIMKMGIGFIILAVLAEPLIYSVHSFSEAANLPSFFISFILVPLTTNARAAISAIKAAWRKKPRTTSLTFSEIYGGVFMNNILGFAVLLALVYMRGLTWEFSGEVLVLLIVCGVMGLIASFRSTFPLWMSFLAFLLYPLSLLLVYAVNLVL